MKGEIDIEVVLVDVPVPFGIASTGTWRQGVKSCAYLATDARRMKTISMPTKGTVTPGPHRNAAARTSEISDGSTMTDKSRQVRPAAVRPRCGARNLQKVIWNIRGDAPSSVETHQRLARRGSEVRVGPGHTRFNPLESSTSFGRLLRGKDMPDQVALTEVNIRRGFSSHSTIPFHVLPLHPPKATPRSCLEKLSVSIWAPPTRKSPPVILADSCALISPPQLCRCLAK